MDLSELSRLEQPIARNEVADVLRRAKALIDRPEKWIQGVGYLDKRYCSVGALGVVVGPDLPHDHPAYVALKTAMGSVPSLFNDTHTHAEVMAAFDKAIALAEAGA